MKDGSSLDYKNLFNIYSYELEWDSGNVTDDTMKKWMHDTNYMILPPPQLDWKW